MGFGRWLCGLSFLGLVSFGVAAVPADGDTEIVRKKDKLPTFTEEREAAALHFVKKHLPELLPILERLKTADKDKYHTEIREIFQVTEWLGDLQADEPKRHALELEMWKTENQALIVVAKLANRPPDEHAKLQI